jgi:6,7-dimethyl-8-ribityllumazine synthase
MRARGGKPKLDLGDIRVVQPQGAPDARIGIVASRFNSAIVEALVQGALRALTAQGVSDDRVVLAWVPGAWELPTAAQILIDAGEVDTVIALGCVIRGETAHFDVIVNESARGLMQIALAGGVPVTNGVLACETEAQALARAGDDNENKGYEAAVAALQMAALYDEFAESIAQSVAEDVQ